MTGRGGYGSWGVVAAQPENGRQRVQGAGVRHAWGGKQSSWEVEDGEDHHVAVQEMTRSQEKKSSHQRPAGRGDGGGTRRQVPVPSPAGCHP